MNDTDLEQRLHDHYRRLDPGIAPLTLLAGIDDAIDREPARRTWWHLSRPAYAMTLTAVAILAIALALRFSAVVGPVGSSPSPGPSSTPVIPSASAGPSSGPTATPAQQPSGSIPPVSAAAWTGLDVQALQGGPINLQSLAAWSGGYLALGSSVGIAPPQGWVSRDGRTWIATAADTFRPAGIAFAAPCSTGVIAAFLDANGNSSAAYSTDGTSWRTSSAPPLRLARGGDLVGSETGAAAILAAAPYGVAFSADCVTWQTVQLPGDPTASVNGIAAFGTGFVAVGDPGTSAGSPVAWSSIDGVHWAAAQVQARTGDGFRTVVAGVNGLVAESTQPGYTPGVTSFWTSPDGRTWTPSSADPLGIWTDGAGSGSANGLFTGDGTRILGYGQRSGSAPYEYWTSLDGSQWTPLGLRGAVSTVTSGQLYPPVLMRDGILWSGDQGSWFGASTP